MLDLKIVLELIGTAVLLGGIIYQFIYKRAINEKRYEDLNNRLKAQEENAKNLKTAFASLENFNLLARQFETLKTDFAHSELVAAQVRSKYIEKIDQLERFVDHLQALKIDPTHPFFVKKSTE